MACLHGMEPLLMLVIMQLNTFIQTALELPDRHNWLMLLWLTGGRVTPSPPPSVHSLGLLTTDGCGIVRIWSRNLPTRGWMFFSCAATCTPERYGERQLWHAWTCRNTDFLSNPRKLASALFSHRGWAERNIQNINCSLTTVDCKGHQMMCQGAPVLPNGVTIPHHHWKWIV